MWTICDTRSKFRQALFARALSLLLSVFFSEWMRFHANNNHTKNYSNMAHEMKNKAFEHYEK